VVAARGGVRVLVAALRVLVAALWVLVVGRSRTMAPRTFGGTFRSGHPALRSTRWRPAAAILAAAGVRSPSPPKVLGAIVRLRDPARRSLRSHPHAAATCRRSRH